MDNLEFWPISIFFLGLLGLMIRISLDGRKPTYRLKPYISIYGGGSKYRLQKKCYYCYLFPYWKNTGRNYLKEDLEQAEKDIKHLISENTIIEYT